MEIGTPHTEIVAEDLGILSRPFDISGGKKVITAGKRLEQKPTLLKTRKEVIEKTSKYKVQDGAKQLANYLRNFHKI